MINKVPSLLAVALALAAPASAFAQNGQEIRLWPDGAPGSEDWSVPETMTGSDGNRVVSNVDPDRVGIANQFNVTSGVLALFDVWRKAGKPTGIHVYDGVSAGFGMDRRGLPVDTWTDRFHHWYVASMLDRPRGR